MTIAMHDFWDMLFQEFMDVNLKDVGSHFTSIVQDNAVMPSRNLRKQQKRRRCRPAYLRSYSSTACCYPLETSSSSSLQESRSQSHQEQQPRTVIATILPPRTQITPSTQSYTTSSSSVSSNDALRSFFNSSHIIAPEDATTTTAATTTVTPGATSSLSSKKPSLSHRISPLSITEAFAMFSIDSPATKAATKQQGWGNNTEAQAASTSLVRHESDSALVTLQYPKHQPRGLYNSTNPAARRTSS